MSPALRSACLAVAILVTATAFPTTPVHAQDKAEQYQWLFVQSATSGEFDGKRLTLEHVGPTILFTDRPQRVTGHMRTDHFVKQWGEGDDSFRQDPPNAAFSIYSSDSLDTAVVEISAPRLAGTTLSYDVKVLDGELPTRFGESTLFIDILGRGAAFVGGAAVGSAAAHSRDQQASTTTTEATHTYTASPPPTSPECSSAQQQLVAATTEQEVKLATQKVQALCQH